MARHDKDTDVKTSKNPEAEQQETVLMESATAYHPDAEHMKRHDDQHRKDVDLAAMLQAKWAKIADDQHRAH